MTTFYLVRHASCYGLGEIIWGRTAGIFLNEAGKVELAHLADCFRIVTLDGVYSSPLERARETAETIARVANLEVQDDSAFNEIEFGKWSGKSLETLASDQCWRRFNTQRSTTRIPGGEMFFEAQARAVGEIERLAAQHREAHLAIVSHADVIKAVIGYVAGTPIDLLQRIEISPCSVSIITMDEHETKLLAVNNRGEIVLR